MADAEQFSLRWNNFHSNLSEGFHSLLEEVDLVDVTLAAEGQYLQAHKLVLSVCSPYFKQLFKANPCKHPIVILKDVCHKDLEALLQFMYQGEVNVRQEELAPFLKTAEMLQIKGLTGNDSKPNVPESPTPTRVQTPPPPPTSTHRVAREPVVKQDAQNTAETSRPFKRQRTESPHLGSGSLSSSPVAHSAQATTVATPQPPSMSPEPPNVEFVPISNPKLEPLEYDNEADGSKASPADLVQLLHSNESSQPPPDLPQAPPVLFNPVAGLPQDSGGSQDSMQVMCTVSSRGRCKLMADGYLYTCHRIYRSSVEWRCERRNCCARRKFDATGALVKLTRHNHPPDANRWARAMQMRHFVSIHSILSQTRVPQAPGGS